MKLSGLRPLIARKKLPEQEAVRSAQLVEVTQKGTWRASVEKRKYALRLQARVPTPDPKPTFDRLVGIDLGVAHAVTTSDGIHYDARTGADLDERADEARRSVSRKRSKKRRSRRHRNELRKLARLTRRAINRRNDDYRHHAKDIAEYHTFVGFEGLRVTIMTRSARGTAKKPGSGVSQKRGLNRSIHRAAWSLFLIYLLSACVMAGTSCQGTLATGASITCFKCGYADKRNRESQSNFVCLSCGHFANADVNAASNVRRRATLWFAERRARGSPGRATVPEPGGRDGRPRRRESATRG